MATETDNAESQAKAQMAHIKAMVERLEHARECGPTGTCLVSSSKILDALGRFHIAGHIRASRDERQSYHDEDAALEAIQESPLSVQVRSGWYDPPGSQYLIAPEAEEYEILLCTGGPACRIRGTLGNHGEPETAILEHQDWGTPWTEYRYTYQYTSEDCPGRPCSSECDHAGVPPSDHPDALLTYAQQFYFGG